MIGQAVSPHTKVVYLITSSMSSLLLTGQLDYLQSQGYEIVVGTGFDGGVPASTFDDAAKVVDLGFRREVSLVADLRSLIRCILFLRAERPDIVNYSTPKAALVGSLASYVSRVPSRFYIVRGLRYETSTGRARTAFRLLEKLICALSTSIVMNSASLIDTAVGDDVVDRGRCSVRAKGSGNGINLELERWAEGKASARALHNLPTDAVLIGFVGRLTNDKGLTDLATAYAEVASTHPSVELVLAGSFEDGDPVSAVTRSQLESDEQVHILGWVENPSSVFHAIDILAFPSYREGLPNVVLEAELAGVPVVAYAATGTVDAMVDGDTGLLVEVGNAAALARSLESLVMDQNLRERLGANGREFVRDSFDRRYVWAALKAAYRRDTLK